MHRMFIFAAGVLAAAALSLAGGAAAKGHQCGRGHAKHTKAIGKSCAKPGKGTKGKANQSPSTSTTDTTSTDTTTTDTTTDGTDTTPSTAPQPNPSQACRAEQAQDPAAFKAKYGTGPKGKNAFGRCVSQHAKAQSDSGGSGDDGSGDDGSDNAGSDNAGATADTTSDDTPAS